MQKFSCELLMENLVIATRVVMCVRENISLDQKAKPSICVCDGDMR